MVFSRYQSILILGLTVVSGLLVACTAAAPPQISEIIVEPSTKNINAGETASLSITVTGATDLQIEFTQEDDVLQIRLVRVIQLQLVQVA